MHSKNKLLTPIGCPQCGEPIQNIQALRGHLVWKHNLRPSEANAIMNSEGEQTTGAILDREAFLGENKKELDWVKE